MSNRDVIAALATPVCGLVPSAGSMGERAVVRLSGPGVLDLLARVCDPPAKPERGIVATSLRLGAHRLPCLLMMYIAPASYTGEESAELIVPAGHHLVAAVMRHLLGQRSDGFTVRAAEPGEFTARAYLNGRLTLEQAEGVGGLIAAANEAQRRAALRALTGETGRRYSAWAEEIADLLALVEAGIDFTDQDDVVPIAAGALAGQINALIDDIAASLGSRDGTRVVEEAPLIVLAGRPNAGKSTLFNALLGRRRAVVAAVAGTTRDALREPLDLSRDHALGGVAILCDTAGVGEDLQGAEEMGAWTELDGLMRDAALSTIADARVVVWCDPTGAFADSSMLQRSDAVIIRVRTKADLPRATRVSSECGGDAQNEPLAVCALDGHHVAALRAAMARAAFAEQGVAGVARADADSAIPRHRHALSDTLRELRAALAASEPGGDDGRAPAQPQPLADAELIAFRLRSALDRIGDICGRIEPDDVLGRIFAGFCIGK